jgi:hypothetical protein
MGAVTVQVVASELLPNGGSDSGLILGFIDSKNKASQNDLFSVDNATTIPWAFITDDSSGVKDAVTISGKEITMTSAQTLLASGLVIFRER